MTALHAEGRVEEAFAAAGLKPELVPGRGPRGREDGHLEMLAAMPLDVARLGQEVGPAGLARRGRGVLRHVPSVAVHDLS